MSTHKYFDEYVEAVSKMYKSEDATEYTYRTDFQELLRRIFEDIKVEEIKQESSTGDENKPDFIIAQNKVPILYIETKALGVSLDKIESSEQMGRYFGYANLVLTDYLEFRFYRNGIPYGEHIKIAEYDKKSRVVKSLPDKYEYLTTKLREFPKSYKEPITSGKHLAKIMGGKALRIRENLKSFLSVDSEKNNEIVRVYESFKKLLVSDLDRDSFSDMYSQTLVYGLFVARYYDDSPDTFTRSEAWKLIPKSNPFLREFFVHISGTHFDERLEHIVDELCMVFSHSNVKDLMGEYFREGKGKDPVIHFYEDFLNEYDSDLRKRMGAYYTPQPVVNFIVRSVDHILKKDFKLKKGLVDNSKYEDGKTHRVQILDPATGTGTFLSAVLNFIYSSIKSSNQPGIWHKYVHSELLPRIHGFELMMAPYTIAHLKTSIAFEKTGFKYFNKRLGIYLTNALEQSPIQSDMFNAFGLAESIAEESKEASIIKTNTPIMVILGNPPYSGVSSNETETANALVVKYKIEPGGREKLQEKKHWLNDDYVKFIALAEDYIERSGTGIVGYITNHSYLDNPTFRGMRWHLLKTFDEIYVIDLHGNVKKKEVCPDGSKDENVFDIQQGVAIFFGIKTNKKKKDELGKVYRYDIWGTREKKFEELDKRKIDKISFELVNPELPNLLFTKQDTKLKGKYDEGFSVNEVFPFNTTGIITGIDKLSIFKTKEELINVTERILNSENPYTEFNIKDGRKASKEARIEDLRKAKGKGVVSINYRPFDINYMYLPENNEYWINSPRYESMRHLILGGNIGFVFKIGNSEEKSAPIHATKHIIDFRSWSRPGMQGGDYLAPLYLYSDNNTKIPNLNTEIVKNIENIVGKTTPEDIFDYIYAVLHSPKYREKYKEFLKIDFPKVPYPKSREIYKKYIKYGKQLRELHLLESPKVEESITTYPISGSDIVEKIKYENGNVYINETQYFGKVPETSWNFYIGGYQPAQKWLKDRKGRELSNDDIEHYQKIIVVLKETDRIMGEIDDIK